MDPTSRLADRIQAQVAASEQQLQDYHQQAEQDFEAMKQRYHTFMEHSRRIVEEIGAPKVQELLRHYDHAENEGREDIHGFYGQIHLKHTPRFPVDAKLKFKLTHDENIENLVISYELDLQPMYIMFDQYDKLVVPIDSVDDQVVSKWLDDKVLSFVETYERIPFIDQYHRKAMATDPVSGHRFPKHLAKCSVDLGGNTYHFVSDEAKRIFVADPSQFIADKP